MARSRDRSIPVDVEYSINESFKWKISYCIHSIELIEIEMNGVWLIVICTETPRCTNVQTVIAVASSVTDHTNWELNIQIEHLFVQSSLHTPTISSAKCTWTLHCIAILIIIRQQNETCKKRTHPVALENVFALEIFIIIIKKTKKKKISHKSVTISNNFIFTGNCHFVDTFEWYFFPSSFELCTQHTAHSTWWRWRRRRRRRLRWRQLIYSAYRELCIIFLFRDLWTIML